MAVKPCSICKHPLAVKVMTTTVGGTEAVGLAMCPNCDYRRCHYGAPDNKCGELVHDIRATRCPKNHSL